MSDELWEKLFASPARPCDCSGDSRPRIFRLPEYIHKLPPSAYTPQVVSLGPLTPSHFDDKQRETADEVKCGTARHMLLDQEQGETPQRLLERCRAGITLKINEIRDFYKLSTETMEDQKLADSMVVDGLFIVHILLMDKLAHKPTCVNGQGDSRRTGNNVGNGCTVLVEEPNPGRTRNTAMAPFGNDAWTKKLICYDLLKVENQIPWFVLHHLCQTLFPRVGVKEYCLLSLIDHMELDVSFPTEQVTIHTDPVHLLDLFRDFLVKGCTCGDEGRPNPPGQTDVRGTAAGDTETNAVQLRGGSNPPGQTDVNCFWTIACGSNVAKPLDPELGGTSSWIPRAVELKRSGIKFRKRKSSKGFLDISFKHGVLEIPPIRTSDYTCALFRNLIAYEQLRPDGGGGNHITAYIVLMDCLVDTVEDVRLLQRSGIIENRLNSDQAAVDLLSNLKHHGPYTMDGNCLLNVFTEVNKWYENKCNRRKATLKRDYCRHPWMVLGLIAGTLILGLALLQAVYKLLDYYHPRDA